MQNKTLVYAILKLKKIGLKEIAPRLAWNRTHLEIKTYKSTLIKVLFGWWKKGGMENNRRKIGVSFLLVGWKFGIKLEIGRKMCLDLKIHHYPYYPLISNYNKDRIVIFILSLFHPSYRKHMKERKKISSYHFPSLDFSIFPNKQSHRID